VSWTVVSRGASGTGVEIDGALAGDAGIGIDARRLAARATGVVTSTTSPSRLGP
jgi:hypothetical protein